VFLRTKESFAGCFPLEPLVIEDAVSSPELSSVRSERSVNSRSAGIDMTGENENNGGCAWDQEKERDRGEIDATRRWRLGQPHINPSSLSLLPLLV